MKQNVLQTVMYCKALFLVQTDVIKSLSNSFSNHWVVLFFFRYALHCLTEKNILLCATAIHRDSVKKKRKKRHIQNIRFARVRYTHNYRLIFLKQALYLCV